MSTTTRQPECMASALYVSLELGSTNWIVLSTTGRGQRPRHARLRAGDYAGLLTEVQRARGRFRVADTGAVYSCYEAGRDGFWLHRCLTRDGVRNVVVDAASIRVTRRRTAKTDRLDAEQLLDMLIRYVAGERRVWSVVQVPCVEVEDRRQLNRELETVKVDCNRIRTRIQSLLITQGIRSPRGDARGGDLARLRTGDGRPIGPGLQARLTRECEHLAHVEERLTQLHAIRRQQISEGSDAISARARRLLRVRGIGEAGAETLSAELFGARTFQNGRQVGALVGLAPTPYRSDQQVREQGHSRAGRGPLRGLLTQLAWGWLRWQPDSALTQWFQTRFAKGARLRRIGIVAVARKLVIALWRYLDGGVIPEGATLKV